MITPIVLGTKTFPTNLIQGPLAGVSCAPFRRLIWRYSQPAFSCTEMISSTALIHQPKASQQRYIKKDPSEGPVCFQLSSNNPEELAEATKQVTAYGADLIDLNCGCPVKKIRSKGAGSSLLVDPPKLYKLIRAMKDNTDLPVSIKIRVESRSGDKFNQEIANVVQEAGLDFLIVHGRHWKEHYETPCNYNEIAFFVDALKIPVIGNGDISCVNTLKKMYATGCAGVMIARAGVGQPWLIEKLATEMRGEHYILPPFPEMGNVFLEHITELIELLRSEKFAILQSRKLAKYYARWLPNKAGFLAAVNHCETLSGLSDIVSQFFV